MKEIPRIGKWTSKVALEEALAAIEENDPVIVVTLSEKESVMRYWTANATNMQVNWMADNVKASIFSEAP